MAMPIRAAFAALLPLALGSCSIMIDADKQQCNAHEDCAAAFGDAAKLSCIDHVCVVPSCQNDDDCAGFGPAYEGTVCSESACVDPSSIEPDGGEGEDARVSTEPPEWACLDEPAPTQTLMGPFKVKLHLQHIVNQSPMVGVTASLCRKIDVGCASPNATEMSDANGDVYLNVDANFTGYVRLTRMDLMTTSYFFNPAIRADVDLPPVQLAPPPIANGLVSQVIAPNLPDPTRGIVLLAAYNCMGMGAAGVTFASNDAITGTTVFYASGGLPSKTATETEPSGFGGFINAAPGPFVISGQRVSDQRELGEISVLVTANQMTITRFFPTPRP